MTTTAATAATATADSYLIVSYVNGQGFAVGDETITADTDYDLGDPLPTVADWLAGIVLDNLQSGSDETVTDSVRVDILGTGGDVLASGFRNAPGGPATLADTTGHHLYDAHTAEDLGPATPEQVAASDEAYAKDGSGGFLIDAAGDVIDDDSSWEAQQPGVRSVYTEVA